MSQHVSRLVKNYQNRTQLITILQLSTLLFFDNTKYLRQKYEKWWWKEEEEQEEEEAKSVVRGWLVI